MYEDVTTRTFAYRMPVRANNALPDLALILDRAMTWAHNNDVDPQTMKWGIRDGNLVIELKREEMIGRNTAADEEV